MSGFNNVIFSRNHYTPHYSTPYRIERVTIQLKELNTTATIYPIFNINEAPINLIKFLTQEYNDEILRGDSLPFFDKLTIEEFQNYWFGQFTAVMCIGDEPDLNDEITVKDWAKRCIGSFFIKSAYPGRCSHICTTNFLVNAGIRHRGIGFFLCECFLRWAPILGYSRCIVDLIFESNLSMKRLLEKCGFSKVGKVMSCAMLKSSKDVLINSFIFTKELTIFEDDRNNSKHANILTYLLSGQYPENSNKDDRSRLRALAYHYEAINSKLYLKGKEVISDPDEQLKIIMETHNKDHIGINRTTSLISSKYYWAKIKTTVKKFVDECDICRMESANSRRAKRVKALKSDSNNNNNNKSKIDSLPTLSNQRNELELENLVNTNKNSIITDNNNNNNNITIPQSTNDLINYINISGNSTYSSSNNNYLSQSIPYKDKVINANQIPILNENSTTTPTTTSINNTSNQDFVSLLNYYNTENVSNINNTIKSSQRNSDIINNNMKRSNVMAFGNEDDFNIGETTGPRTTEDLHNEESNPNTNNTYGIATVEDDDEEDDDDYEYNGEEEAEEVDDEEDDDEEGEDGEESYDQSVLESLGGKEVSDAYMAYTKNVVN